jgi:hypothetical protein
MQRVMLVGLVVLTVAASPASARARQSPACLHGPNETAADAARRQNALRLVRAINTSQARSLAIDRVYRTFQGLTDLGLPGRPMGFATQLSVEGSTYAVVIKDTLDPCRYTLFSDQDGVIYVGSPLH